MSHRNGITEVAKFLESQKKQKLSEALSYDEYSDTQLQEIVHAARMTQHSLVRGSIAEIENNKRIDSAMFILELRLNELSKKTLGDYIKKSTDSAVDNAEDAGYQQKSVSDALKGKNPSASVKKYDTAYDSYNNKKNSRVDGIGKAVSRLTKESSEIDELSKKTLGDYIKNASNDVGAKSAAVGRYSQKAETDLKDDDYSSSIQNKKIANKAFDQSWKRRQGMGSAVSRLVKEALDKNNSDMD